MTVEVRVIVTLRVRESQWGCLNLDNKPWEGGCLLGRNTGSRQGVKVLKYTMVSTSESGQLHASAVEELGGVMGIRVKAIRQGETHTMMVHCRGYS